MFEEKDSGMCTMITRNTENHSTTLSLQFGIPSTYLILAHSWKFDKPKRTARVALKVNHFFCLSNETLRFHISAWNIWCDTGVRVYREDNIPL